jgi:hypothetical protein
MSFPQDQIQRRPQTMFNDFRYPMPTSDKPVEGAKYPARWTWECGLNGNIYFKVNDGVWGQQDKNAKSKEVELSVFDRGALFGLIEEAIRNPDFTKSQYLVKKTTFGQGGRMNDHPSILATFTIIRDAEGCIKVGYTKGTYKVMFPFTSPYDSVILMAGPGGGEPVENRGLMSRVYAKAFIDFSRVKLDDYEFTNFKPREKKGEGNNSGGGRGGNNWGGNSNSGGNQGGGSNWNGNGGGNSGGGQQTRQTSTPDFDDDIDF